MGEESTELDQFREEWKAEVRARTTGTPKEASSSVTHHPFVGESPAPNAGPPGTSAFASKSRTPSAVELYRSAVHAEEDGLLDEALTLYRRAFRSDPHVDKVYRREEATATASKALELKGMMESSSANLEEAVVHQLQGLNLQAPKARSSELDAILAAFPDELVFISQDEKTVSPFQSLPLEVLIEVLLHLAYNNDVKAIERFAIVSKKARAVSLDPVIWRYIVRRTYVPPQILRINLLDDIALRYKANYRQIYIEHPRLRLDGVYIAVCHYVEQPSQSEHDNRRPGLSENAWVSISHLVTYHRYLRFLSSGDVLSLRANDDSNPKEIVHHLKPGLRMDGFMRGKWYLDGDDVYVTDLVDPYAPVSKYSFQMTLSLKSRPLGRWNKLDLAGYHSVEIETGEACPFPLRHERPFWFSKVRSY